MTPIARGEHTVHYVAPRTLNKPSTQSPTSSTPFNPCNGDISSRYKSLRSQTKEIALASSICSDMLRQSYIRNRQSESLKRTSSGKSNEDCSQGTSPSGTMCTSIIFEKCPGFPGCNSSILIEYDIPSGTQYSYHPHPGHPFDGTRRETFLPNNRDGQNLLLRLTYAWKKGLIFSIGTSLTTRKQNSVVWSSSIPHKTSLSGGKCGWPDDTFFIFCNVSLDKLGVPRATMCVEPARGRVEEEIWYDPQPNFSYRKGLVSISPSMASTEVCNICFDPLPYECAVETRPCRHRFHQSCILRCLKQGFRCPVCKKSMYKCQGSSPLWKMSIRHNHFRCPGFGLAKTISIQYEIPSGVQSSIHCNPGTSFDGTTRVAYIPDNPEGLKLLKRLKYAWRHGLIFNIGTSRTSGMNDVVIWASIPHKTSLYGGSQGFPDRGYIDNCNGALDALDVPPASDCL